MPAPPDENVHEKEYPGTPPVAVTVVVPVVSVMGAKPLADFVEGDATAATAPLYINLVVPPESLTSPLIINLTVPPESDASKRFGCLVVPPESEASMRCVISVV
jgi:hypothetical protein